MKHIYLIVLLLVSCIVVGQEFNNRYELINLGRKVNTGYHEGGPVVSADGKMIYFFVHNHPDNTYGKEGSQDIWFSTKDEQGEWTEAQHLKSPLNKHHSNQVFTVMPDGNTLFIRGGRSKNSKGFSITRKTGNGWSDVDEIGVEDFNKMNNGKFYGATLSSDGKVMLLYFSEKKNSTFSDLYVSKITDNGNFSVPVKLPDNINTGRDEFAPFLAPDDKTVYFSSNRKDMGVGSADIYMTRRLDDTWLKWSDPENLGRPVNTKAFDSYMSVDGEGNVYTAQSGRTIDGGNLDIFQLVPKEIAINLRGLAMDGKTLQGINSQIIIKKEGKAVDTLITEIPGGSYQVKLEGEGRYGFTITAVGYHAIEDDLVVKGVFADTTIIKDFKLRPVKRNPMLSGVVYDIKTNEPIDASINIAGKQGRGSWNKATSKGYYEQELTTKDWYLLNASSEGYLNATDSIVLDNDGQTLLTKDIYMTPIEVGAIVRLNNIFFDFDKTTLKSESFVELNKVVEFLEDNPTVEIEIAGHTDSKGSDDYNLNLSQGRAQAVVDYLISEGIDEFRLAAKGYGESKPMETNDTDEGRATNRRVEFTVLKK